MDDMWRTILGAFGGTAALLALLGFLGRSAIKYWLDKDLSAFKARLQSEEIASTERLKASLAIVASEHQVRFTRLHEERAKVIQKVHEMLNELHWAAQGASTVLQLSGGPTPADELVRADKLRAELYRYFAVNRIYLPATACSSIDQLLDNVRRTLIRLSTYMDVNKFAPSDVLQEQREVFLEAYAFFRDGVQAPLTELEDSFRALLDPPRMSVV